MGVVTLDAAIPGSGNGWETHLVNDEGEIVDEGDGSGAWSGIGWTRRTDQTACLIFPTSALVCSTWESCKETITEQYSLLRHSLSAVVWYFCCSIPFASLLCADAVAVVLTHETTGEKRRFERNEHGTFFRVFQPNKWQKKRREMLAQQAALEPATADVLA